MSNSLLNIFWFRRDLRLTDNAALYHSLKEGLPVLPIFIFDKNILNSLEDRRDRRVQFIHSALVKLQEKLVEMGASIQVFHGFPIDIFSNLVSKYNIQSVFANHDYEPEAIERDEKIRLLLRQHGIRWQSFKDQVIFDRSELVKEDGKPYTIFTPYAKKWRQKLNSFYLRSYPVEKFYTHFYKANQNEIPSLESIGFSPTDKDFPLCKPDRSLISEYDRTRDFPAQKGTSRLGVHLRFGTISIRQLAREAMELNEVYLKELIWREFFQMILWHFPQVGRGKAFHPAYDHIRWRNQEEEFDKWCCGETGYPIVDAGMRELNATGFMHNRLRMITASFLSKHLLIDWRWGEAYFAEKLLDFDLAANNGGWQWSSGSGCDAAPYFRIFNPSLQAAKFDPSHEYIRQWVPEFEEPNYPPPIVDHKFARIRALETYAAAIGNH